MKINLRSKLLLALAVSVLAFTAVKATSDTMPRVAGSQFAALETDKTILFVPAESERKHWNTALVDVPRIDGLFPTMCFAEDLRAKLLTCVYLIKSDDHLAVTLQIKLPGESA